ncbi:hypothetical protein F4805DRAFT_429398 [Annulohypoxylon moriforme]|nr:hypothetical protein F4805DRAFT_429398 [Annulohypoxylon moriforme]
MTDWKGIVKNGWHPEKEGTSLKGQMKGLIGRGDNSSSHASNSHSATPITSLRDPSSFGPPPKHVGSGAHSPASATPQHQPHTDQTYGVQQTSESPVEAKAYRVDTTGLSTSHLPPPPGRKDSPLAAPPSLAKPKPSAPPSLPPRLPPRSGNTSPVQTQSPASTGRQSPGYLNQGAINRLSAAGISVPGLGIGGKAAPPPPPNRSSSNSPSAGSSPTKTSGGRFSGLQNRFSRFGGSSPKPEPAAETEAAPSPAVPTKGTTWAEKQAALKTAANFRNNPKSVSFSDAKAAASTAHNFQQRHGDQVASGMKTANGLGQRFGMFENSEQNGQRASASSMGQISVVAGKKPPPPPPTKKKPQLPPPSHETSAPAPPPIPIGTRPRFN